MILLILFGKLTQRWWKMPIMWELCDTAASLDHSTATTTVAATIAGGGTSNVTFRSRKTTYTSDLGDPSSPGFQARASTINTQVCQSHLSCLQTFSFKHFSIISDLKEKLQINVNTLFLSPFNSFTPSYKKNYATTRRWRWSHSGCWLITFVFQWNKHTVTVWGFTPTFYSCRNGSGSVVNDLRLRFVTAVPDHTEIAWVLVDASSKVTGFDIETTSITVDNIGGSNIHPNLGKTFCSADVSFLFSSLRRSQPQDQPPLLTLPAAVVMVTVKQAVDSLGTFNFQHFNQHWCQTDFALWDFNLKNSDIDRFVLNKYN